MSSLVYKILKGKVRFLKATMQTNCLYKLNWKRSWYSAGRNCFEVTSKIDVRCLILTLINSSSSILFGLLLSFSFHHCHQITVLIFAQLCTVCWNKILRKDPVLSAYYDITTLKNRLLSFWREQKTGRMVKKLTLLVNNWSCNNPTTLNLCSQSFFSLCHCVDKKRKLDQKKEYPVQNQEKRNHSHQNLILETQGLDLSVPLQQHQQLIAL